MAENWPVTVPRETANDDSVTVIHWLVPHGRAVTRGTPIVEVETSKATVELTAERDGFLIQVADELQRVPIGSPVGFVSSEAPIPRSAEQTRRDEGPSSRTQTWSSQARALAARHNIAPELLADRTIVREQDVRDLLPSNSDGREVRPSFTRPNTHSLPISPQKRSEINALSSAMADALLSMVTCQIPIPRSFTRPGIGFHVSQLPTVAWATAQTLPKYPLLNAFIDGNHIHCYDEVNVGIAINLDKGLLVPVLPMSEKTPLDEIAKLIREATVKYLSGSLTPKDMSGGTFTITDLSTFGVSHIAPLLNRNQTAILAIGGDPERSLLLVTLAFDHRACDGSYGGRFLSELRQLIVTSHGIAYPMAVPQCLECGLQLTDLPRDGRGSYLLPVVGPSETPTYVCSSCIRVTRES